MGKGYEHTIKSNERRKPINTWKHANLTVPQGSAIEKTHYFRLPFRQAKREQGEKALARTWGTILSYAVNQSINWHSLFEINWAASPHILNGLVPWHSSYAFINCPVKTVTALHENTYLCFAGMPIIVKDWSHLQIHRQGRKEIGHGTFIRGFLKFDTQIRKVLQNARKRTRYT